MKIVTKYICEVCNTQYDREKEALQCEERGLEGFEGINVGDVVIAKTVCGWYDGDPDWIAGLQSGWNRPSMTKKQIQKLWKQHKGNPPAGLLRYDFYYVVTHILPVENSHQLNYHLRTEAIASSSDLTMYSGGMTTTRHFQIFKVKKPPQHIKDSIPRLLTFPPNCRLL